jgi:hypothetical protein
MPLLKKGAKTLEREALKTGLNIAGDVVQGRNIKQAAKSRLKSTGENLLQKAMDTNLPSVGRGTTISTWLILTCLWKHISWMTTILHWMAERTLDLSTYFDLIGVGIGH